MRKLTKLDNGLYRFDTSEHMYTIERCESLYGDKPWWLLKRVEGFAEVLHEESTLRDMRDLIDSCTDKEIDSWH